MPMELDPRVRHFQEIRRKRREKAIQLNTIREQIKKANPTATENQVESILQAHLRAKQARTISVNGRKVKVYNR